MTDAELTKKIEDLMQRVDATYPDGWTEADRHVLITNLLAMFKEEKKNLMIELAKKGQLVGR